MSDKTLVSDVPAGDVRKRFPLYLTLAAVFVTLFVVFGLALIGFFDSESKRIELLGADDLMDRIGRHMQTSIAELYLPAQSLVDVASKSVPLAAADLDDRLLALGALTEALRLNPHMSSVFVGYEDGEFFLVRTIGDRRVAAVALNAPNGSRFAVQSIERDGDGSVRSEVVFLDDGLGVLDRRPFEADDFDPREREWFRRAIGKPVQITTDFYVFFTTGEVGISFARRLVEGGGVVGADLALADLSAGLAAQKVTPSTKIAIFDQSMGVIALSTPELRVPVRGEGPTDRITMPRLDQLDDPVYGALAARARNEVLGGRFVLDAESEQWLASVSSVPTRRGVDVNLATLIPRNELLADVDRIRNQSVLIAIGLLVIAAGIVLAVARGLSSSLRGLAKEAEQIRRFKLGRPVTVRSRIREVDELATTMGVMKHSLQQFFAISKALSAEKDYRKLLEMILREARAVAHADGGAVLITNDEETALEVAVLEDTSTETHYGGTSGVEAPFSPVPLTEKPDGALPDLDAETARTATTVRIDDLGVGHSYDPSGACERFGWTVSAGKSLLNVPLTDQKGEIVGVLQLVNARSSTGEIMPFDPEVVPSIEAISSDAAVALDLRRLLQAQKDLLDAIIHMIAGAIDAKSPYTHGHCQRVPEIAKDLARAAHEVDEGPFADFELTDDEWYELHIASWLHDCGKVTTPEYVVDKATRLETITNRLHEIRTRFEVLWRDAEIDYLKALADDTAGGGEEKARFEKRLDQIRRDYQFIAECNSGETFMSEERIGRVKEIASQTWTRHLDDRIGLSHDELERVQRSPAPDLPAEERLLADKVEHLVYRDGPAFGDNPHGFKMEVPEHLYNHGEVYNLCTRRGTLSDEERFKINEHIVETINMLGQLPFPKEMRRVPEWAGNHHEKLDGTGYPRRLGAGNLSILARIMAIADIFEALTASDRPYKPPKKLSTSLRIMSSFRDEGHICPELFDLFLTAGIFRQYGEKHLRPEQVDEVDIEEYVRDSSAN